MDSALLRALQGCGGLRRLSLGSYPTPVLPLDLGAVVAGFAGRAWVKREDRASGLVGGNKVRKLEFLLADAAARGATTLLTVGGIGSNHCLATAVYAPEAGLSVHLAVFPHHVTPHSRRTLLAMAAAGARLTYCPSPSAAPAVLGALYARERWRGRRPYVLWPGGSSPLGTLGWVEAGVEIAEQVGRGELEAPDAVFCAYGSGGTAAGLAVGLALAGLDAEVAAVRVYDPPFASRRTLRWLASRTARLLERLAGKPVPEPGRLRMVAGYLGAGYAEPTEASSAAAEVGRQLGLPLDPTYTAKAFAAFLDAAASPRYRKARLLFVHTYHPDGPAPLLEGASADLLPPRLRRFA